MKKEYKVSIIIPVYNGANFLAEAIESALNQSYKNVEIIVVNDGSTDWNSSKRIALSYGEKIRYLEQENKGVAAALNYGIKEMTGEFFSWLSHDDLFFERKIELQINEILKSGDINKISYSNYMFFKDELLESSKTDFLRYFDKEQLEKSVFPLFLYELHFGSLLFHKNHFKRIGVFNESLKTAQDNEFIFRLLRGNKTVIVDEVLSAVRLHNNSGTKKYKEKVDLENNLILYNMINILPQKEVEEVFLCEENFYIKIAGIIRSMNGLEELKNIENMIIKKIGIKEKKETIKIYDKDMYIFGAGQYGIRLKYELDSKGIKVLGFVDNDESKQGDYICGAKCYSINDIDIENAIIVIAQKYKRDVEEQLIKLGISEFLYKEDVDSKIFNILSDRIPKKQGERL